MIISVEYIDIAYGFFCSVFFSCFNSNFNAFIFFLYNVHCFCSYCRWPLYVFSCTWSSCMFCKRSHLFANEKASLAKSRCCVCCCNMFMYISLLFFFRSVWFVCATQWFFYALVKNDWKPMRISTVPFLKAKKKINSPHIKICSHNEPIFSIKKRPNWLSKPVHRFYQTKSNDKMHKSNDK